MGIHVPHFVAVAPGARFWVYQPTDAEWDLNRKPPATFICPAVTEKFVIMSMIGHGTYGKVYQARHQPNDGLQFAIKIFTGQHLRDTPISENDFLREYYVYKTAGERGIPTETLLLLYGAFFLRTASGMRPCLVMELMDGDVRTLMDKKRNVKTFLQICTAICRAVISLHKLDVFHMDIKSGNVLYREDFNNTVFKLADLGLSCYFGGATPVPCQATGTYFPPEWRSKRDPRVPSFSTVHDKEEMKRGEVYALCHTLLSLAERVRAPPKSPHYNELMALIFRGAHEDIRIRRDVTVPAILQSAMYTTQELFPVLSSK